ncbi:MAG: RNA polymerase-binding protein RbpA [Propionibacteriaceae bacterium]|jgi:hypothetical protein|nr:RNA polymerase-binding protein RbpA [Propionibacteriaceae bacterium]
MTAIHSVPEPVERVETTYTCPSQHKFTKVFAANIAVPSTWDCPRCGKTATSDTLDGHDETGTTNETRSHWDMLRERRSMDELTTMLADRVDQLRNQ